MFSPADQTNIFANSADPDEPSHQYYAVCHSVLILTATPIWNNGSDQIQRWKGLSQKLGDERVNANNGAADLFYSVTKISTLILFLLYI